MHVTDGPCGSGLRMTITNAEGQNIEMASDYATWESKDGLKFRFHMRQTTDTAVTSQTDGEASLPENRRPRGSPLHHAPRKHQRVARRNSFPDGAHRRHHRRGPRPQALC